MRRRICDIFIQVFVVLSLWIRSFSLLVDVDGLTFGSFADYLTVAEIREYLDRFSTNYPSISSEPFVYGKSFEGRDLIGICVGVPCQNLTAESTGEVPEALFTSLIHAREPMSMMGVVSFMNFLASSYKNDPMIKMLLERRKLHILPLLNPDGYHKNYVSDPSGGGMQRKNCRQTCTPRDIWDEFGIDLNRNFPPCFDHDSEGSSTKRCQEDYRGSYPLSEPESLGLHEWLTNRNISVALNIHSYGRMLNLPNMCRNLGPTRDDEIIRNFAKVALKNMPSWKYGHPYDDGMLYTVNGALSDYMYTAHSIFAMAPEMGPSHGSNRAAFWPRGRDNIRKLAEEARPLFLETLWRAGPLYEVHSAVVQRVENSGPRDDRNVLCVHSFAKFTLHNVGFRGPRQDGRVSLYLGSGRSSDDAIASVLVANKNLRANVSINESGACATLDSELLKTNCNVVNVTLSSVFCEESSSTRRDLAASVVAIAITDDWTCTVFLITDGSKPIDVMRYPAGACRGFSTIASSSLATCARFVPQPPTTLTSPSDDSNKSLIELKHSFIVGFVVVVAIAVVVTLRRYNGFRFARLAVSYSAVSSSDNAESQNCASDSSGGVELGRV